MEEQVNALTLVLLVGDPLCHIELVMPLIAEQDMGKIDLHRPLDDDLARRGIERHCYHPLIVFVFHVRAEERNSISSAVLQHRTDTGHRSTTGKSLVTMFFSPLAFRNFNGHVVHEELAIADVEAKLAEGA